MSTKYTSPPNQTLFNEKVWEIVRRIPPGKVATYGQVAGLVYPPDAEVAQEFRAFGARWVGGAMAKCPADVPWQRVVNSQGKISLPPSGGGELQHMLLESEGINFDERDRINLKKYQWMPEIE